jgi:hypothetical protein
VAVYDDPAGLLDGLADSAVAALTDPARSVRAPGRAGDTVTGPTGEKTDTEA